MLLPIDANGYQGLRPIDRIPWSGRCAAGGLGLDDGRTLEDVLPAVGGSRLSLRAVVCVMALLAAAVAGDLAGRRRRVCAWRTRGACGLSIRRSWTRAFVACT